MGTAEEEDSEPSSSSNEPSSEDASAALLDASAAARWAAGTARAVAEACGSLGRLPVALVPFEPNAADLFPDLFPGRGEKRRRGEVEVRRSR